MTGMLRHVARVLKLDAVAAAVASEKTEAKLAVVPRLFASAKATAERVHCQGLGCTFSSYMLE